MFDLRGLRVNKSGSSLNALQRGFSVTFFYPGIVGVKAVEISIFERRNDVNEERWVLVATPTTGLLWDLRSLRTSHFCICYF